MPTWSDCEGHGRIHEELTRLLGNGDRPGDALFFASAGNTAQRHWSGMFRDGGNGYHVWKRVSGSGAHGECDQTLGQRTGVRGAMLSNQCRLRSDCERMRAIARTGGPDATRRTGAASAMRWSAFVPESGHEYRVRVRQMRNCAPEVSISSCWAAAYTISPVKGAFPSPAMVPRFSPSARWIRRADV